MGLSLAARAEKDPGVDELAGPGLETAGRGVGKVSAAEGVIQ